MCIVVFQQQVDVLLEVMPSLPIKRILISLQILPLRIIFHPTDSCSVENTLPKYPTVLYEGNPRPPVKFDGSKYDHVVVTTEIKQIPSLLYPAIYTYESCDSSTTRN